MKFTFASSLAASKPKFLKYNSDLNNSNNLKQQLYLNSNNYLGKHQQPPNQ